MKTVVNISDEQREFIKGILNESREQFKKSFLEMACSDSPKRRDKFVAHYTLLAELAYIQSKETQRKGGEPC